MHLTVVLLLFLLLLLPVLFMCSVLLLLLRTRQIKAVYMEYGKLKRS